MFSLLYQKKAIADDGDCLMRRVNSKTRGVVQIFFHAESEREKISVQNQLLAQKVCTKSLRFSSAVKSSAMVIIILHTHALFLLLMRTESTQREYLSESCYFFFEDREDLLCDAKKSKFGGEDIFVGTAGDGGWL